MLNAVSFFTAHFFLSCDAPNRCVSTTKGLQSGFLSKNLRKGLFVKSRLSVLFLHRRAYNSQKSRSIKKKVKAFSASPFVLKAVMAGQVNIKFLVSVHRFLWCHSKNVPISSRKVTILFILSSFHSFFTFRSCMKPGTQSTQTKTQLFCFSEMGRRRWSISSRAYASCIVDLWCSG